jgi:hypothetical protein
MRPRLTTPTTLAALCAVGLAAAGCDWRAFDDLKTETPVLSVGAPSGYDESSSFGQIVLPVTAPQSDASDGSVAARFLASAATRTRIAVIDLDARGQAHGETVSSPILDGLDATLSPINSLAEIPGKRLALLGAPTAAPAQLLTMELDPPFTVTPFISSPEQQLGLGVAAANLGGGAAAEYVAVSAGALHVYVDGQAAADLVHVDSGAGDPCPIALPTSLPRLNRAVVIGQLLQTAQPSLQIAVGTPTLGGAGTVSIFSVDVGTGTFTCEMALKPTAGAAADPLFGRALAIGDFDGDGHADLLVGSPPTAAYLYTFPLRTAPTRLIPNPNAVGSVAGEFGASVAAFDLDGKPGDEAFVGDPSATLGGKSGAGNVHVYAGPQLASEITPALAPHDPKAGDGYGMTVAGLPFCVSGGTDGGAAGCAVLPMVGSGPHVFTYFTRGPADPRLK